MNLPLLRSELIQLRRPLLLWTCASALFLSALFVSGFALVAHDDFGSAKNWLDVLRAGPTDDVCDLLKDGSERSCATLHAEALRQAELWMSSTKKIYRLRGAIGHPLGAGGVSAGFSTSLPGILALSLLSAGHVAGEWHRGTAGSRFSRNPHRMGFLLAKFLSLFLAGVLMLLLVALGLAVIGPLAVRLGGLPPSAPDFDPLAFTIQQVTRALVVIAVVAALGLAAGVVVRRAIGTLGFLVALFGLSAAAAMSARAFVWSPASWISAVMGFDPGSFLGDHMWVSELPGHVSTERAFLLLGSFGAVCILLAFARLRLSPLDE